MLIELKILGKVAYSAYKELTPSEIEKLKKYLLEEKLGFDDIQLSKIDIKVINYFLKLSIESNESLENINVNEFILIKEIGITTLEFDEFKNKLQNNGLVYTAVTGGGICQLNYIFYWRTNYLKETQEGLHFLDLLISFIKLIDTKEIKSTDYLDIYQIDKDVSCFTDTQINALLSYSNENDLILEIIRNDLRFIFREFKLNKTNVTKLKKILNIN